METVFVLFSREISKWASPDRTRFQFPSWRTDLSNPGYLLLLFRQIKWQLYLFIVLLFLQTCIRCIHEDKMIRYSHPRYWTDQTKSEVEV